MVWIFLFLQTSFSGTIYLDSEAPAQGNGSMKKPFNNFFFGLKHIFEQESGDYVELIILGDKPCSAILSSEQPLFFQRNVEIRGAENKRTLIFEEFPRIIVGRKKKNENFWLENHG